MGMRRPTGAAFAITDPNGDRLFVDVVKSGRINRPIENYFAGNMAARWVINMIGHWGVFRGGWTILVFADDRKTVTNVVRCGDREQAAELSQGVRARGLMALTPGAGRSASARTSGRLTRRAALTVWMNARRGWQELLINWLLASVSLFLGDASAAVALQRSDMPPRALDFFVPGFIMALIFTAGRRWKLRYDRREDAD